MEIIKKHLNAIPLLMLAVFCLYTTYTILFGTVNINGTLYKTQFTNQLYAGFGLLLVTLSLYVVKSRYFKYGVLGLLLLWLIGTTNYLPVAWGVGVGLGAARMSVQIVALMFIAVYYLLNRKRADSFLLSLVAVWPDAERAARMRREEIDRFKKTFRNFSVEKLQVIVIEKKLVSNAIMAAQELLSEKSGASVSHL